MTTSHASHRSYQIATSEVMMPATASTTGSCTSAEILLAERIVDQELEAERHDDVEQRLDQQADADEGQRFPVFPREGRMNA